MKAASIAPGVGRWEAIRRGLCPRCRKGRIFSGTVAMHDACPSCGLRFSREQGYFTGAMYVSYGIAVPVLVVLTVVLGLIFPDWPISWNLAVCVILFLPFVPAVFRHSRILFIHFDRSVDP